MVLIGVRRFKIEKCLKGCHTAIYVEPVEYIGNEEFHRIVNDFRKSYMDLVGRRPWWLYETSPEFKEMVKRED